LFAAAENKTMTENTVSDKFGEALGAEVEAHPDFAKDPRGAEEVVLGKARFDELKSARGDGVKDFYGTFFLIVNLAGLFIQMFLVSRLFKYIGVRGSLFVLPVIAFGGYAAMGLIGGLLVVRAAKTAENSMDYSLQNTVKQALFLPTSREAKYKAKAAIDTFFVRFGDTASAAIVAIGLNVLAFGPKQFAFVNVALCGVWIALNIGIAREHKRMVGDERVDDDAKAELPKARVVESKDAAETEDAAETKDES
jgi:AAA family ATP:ADP antiporter